MDHSRSSTTVERSRYEGASCSAPGTAFCFTRPRWSHGIAWWTSCGATHPLATAAKTLQVHVSRLRRELGDIVVLPRRRLRDPHRAGRCSTWRTSSGSSPRAGRPWPKKQPERASERLREALGAVARPTAGGACRRAVRADRDRVASRRSIWTAVEERYRSRTSRSGATHELIIRSSSHSWARNPYRERLRAQSRCSPCTSPGNRPRRSLPYQDARRVLVDELGVEPGARLLRVAT